MNRDEELPVVWVIETDHGIFRILESEQAAKALAWEVHSKFNHINVTRWFVHQ